MRFPQDNPEGGSTFTLSLSHPLYLSLFLALFPSLFIFLSISLFIPSLSLSLFLSLAVYVSLSPPFLYISSSLWIHLLQTALTLLTHNRMYHQDKKWCCRICGKGFERWSLLRCHLEKYHLIWPTEVESLYSQYNEGTFKWIRALLNTYLTIII